MTKQKPKASQQLVLSPPGAWGGGKIDDIHDLYLDLALYSNNPKLTISQCIWQLRVQRVLKQIQEFTDKIQVSHDIAVELLNIAIQQGQVEKARSLLDINIKEKLSNEAATLLVRSALSAKQYEILNVLLTNDKIDLYSLRLQDFNRSLLHLAIEYKNQEAFDKLLNHPEINVNLKDNGGRLPLSSAIEYKNQEAFEKLLNHPDINVNLGDDYAKKWTPLHYAIFYKNQEAFKALLNRPEIDVNLPNKCKLTPLHLAVLYGDAQMVQTLLEKFKGKIDIDAQHINEETPLYHVKSAEVMKLLLDYGADIHQKIVVKGKELSLADIWSSGRGGEEKKKWYLEYQQSYHENIKYDNTGMLSDMHLSGDSEHEVDT